MADVAIPDALVAACERNAFVWHRQNPEAVEAAFDSLALAKRGEFFAFTKRYCLQFTSPTLPFELVDFVECDGEISGLVGYAHDELEIAKDLIPISPYEASSIYCVRVSDDSVILVAWSYEIDSWEEERLSDSFFAFMLEHL